MDRVHAASQPVGPRPGDPRLGHAAAGGFHARYRPARGEAGSMDVHGFLRRTLDTVNRDPAANPGVGRAPASAQRQRVNSVEDECAGAVSVDGHVRVLSEGADVLGDLARGGGHHPSCQ
jgi:hypothetical protein